MSSISKKLVNEELYLRENEISHAPVDGEMQFYDSVKRGDMEEVMRLYRPLGGKGFGVLSEDSLRNLKYHLVISIAFITRFCIEGGMEHELAYSLSDLYIRQADVAATEKEITGLHKEVIQDFTERMGKLKREKVFSKPVVQCLEYIHRNLNRAFQISEMAEEIGLTTPYLSRLFHQETGVTISRHIMKKRIDVAARMLEYSEYTAADIGNFLAFSSHSHFIQAFKKETGLTPKQYRDKYFHRSGHLSEKEILLNREDYLEEQSLKQTLG